MGTCAAGGQAVGVAAAMAVKRKLLPGELRREIESLQQRLLQLDCYLPGIPNTDEKDLARTAEVSASSYVPGEEPKQVVNGWSRPIGNQKNCWRPEEEEKPWLELQLKEKSVIAAVQILFDSNLSREITISLSEKCLRRQEKGTPPELVKDFLLEFLDGERTVLKKMVTGNYQRRCEILLEQPVLCNRLRLTVVRTHGTKTPRIFEIRCYS